MNVGEVCESLLLQQINVKLRQLVSINWKIRGYISLLRSPADLSTSVSQILPRIINETQALIEIVILHVLLYMCLLLRRLTANRITRREI